MISKKRLGDLIQIKHGFAFGGEYFCDEITKDILVTPGNFKIGGGFKKDKFKYYKGPIDDEYILHAGDLIVTMTDLSKEGDTLGFPALVPKDNSNQYLHNQRIGKVLFKSEQIDKKYLYYLLCTREYRNEILATSTGSTVKHTAPNRIENFEFYLPPLERQLKVARSLISIDDKIELNNKINETLESMAKAIFKDWFIDFGPVKAKAEGKKPFGMDEETASLFPNSFEDSELGLIPKGWQVKSLGHISNCFDSKRVPLSGAEREKRKGGYPYYGAASHMGNVDDFLFDGIHVLMGEDGSVVNKNGSPVLQYVWGKFWVNNHAHVLTGKEISTEHLLLFLKHVIIAPYVTGAVQPKLNQGNMNRIPFVKAPTEINLAFAKLIEPLFEKIRANKEENDSLVQARDLLLPKLISGEIQLSEDVCD